MGAREFAADFSLASRASNHDVGAQRELVQRLLPRVRGVCQALLRDPTNARDASQVAMLEVLRSVGTYRGECSLEHWSDRIISRTALRWIARERRSARIPLGDPHLHESELTPSKTFMRECLEVLPEPQATALVLRTCFEYTVDEIAEMTQVSRNTVKDRLVRARQTLRALLRGGTPASGFDGFAEVATPLVSPRRDGRALSRPGDDAGARSLPGRRSRP
jgi:RNA polymerase sigma-70 factor, ECF subfamily